MIALVILFAHCMYLNKSIWDQNFLVYAFTSINQAEKLKSPLYLYLIWLFGAPQTNYRRPLRSASQNKFMLVLCAVCWKLYLDSSWCELSQKLTKWNYNLSRTRRSCVMSQMCNLILLWSIKIRLVYLNDDNAISEILSFSDKFTFWNCT